MNDDNGEGKQKLREAIKRGLCQPHWLDEHGDVRAPVEDLTTDIADEILALFDGDVTHGAIGRRRAH